MSEIATRNPQQELVAQIRSDTFKQQIEAALPQNVTVERFVRATVTALMTNGDLAGSDPTALFQAVIRCAQDGLLPDGREAALVLFGNRATYLPMVGGYRKIAAEHGWTIRSAVVYANDEFTYELGLDLRLVHRPAGLREERGEVIGAYAIGTHRDGRKEIEVMSRDEIEKVRAVSRSKDRGPWKDWFERMVEKTPVRRLFPKLPLDPADADRVARLFATDRDLTPEAAAALLYGNDHAAALPAATDSPEATAASDPADSQQAEETVTDPVPVSSAPGDDEPEPTLFQIPESAIDEAGSMVVTKGIEEVKGKSLAEIAEGGGTDWLAWAVRRAPNYWPDPFRAALELFVQHRLPVVWAAFQTERDAA